MQLGISSFTYGWSVDKIYSRNPINEIDLVEKTKQFGLTLLQLGDNLPLHDLDELQINTFKAALDANGIRLEIGARGLTESCLLLYISLCKKMGARLLRFVVDTTEYEPGIYEIVQIINSQLHELEQNNITLAIENHDRLKAAEFAEIMVAVNSKNVGICLDTANSLGAGESIEYIIDTLVPFTVNLHLKDFGIARLPHKQGFIVDGRIIGKGMLNVPFLIERLKPFNRCRTAILEQWVPPEISSGETVKKEEQWAAESMAYLKALPFWS